MGLYGSSTTTRYMSYLTYTIGSLRLMRCLNSEKACQLVACRSKATVHTKSSIAPSAVVYDCPSTNGKRLDEQQFVFSIVCRVHLGGHIIISLGLGSTISPSLPSFLLPSANNGPMCIPRSRLAEKCLPNPPISACRMFNIPFNRDETSATARQAHHILLQDTPVRH